MITKKYFIIFFFVLLPFISSGQELANFRVTQVVSPEVKDGNFRKYLYK